ncbi:MAG TPA: hypothetical protein VFA32_13120 [Dehalococcoidia bacterium]|nr:hypothetical protein [Dehalococcoidia bacterium]
MEACARDDEAEHRRLWDSAPRKTYTMRDAEVTDRLQAVDTLALVVLVELAAPLAKLQMLKAQALLLDYLKNWEAGLICGEWYHGYCYGRAEGWRLAGMEGEPPELGDEDGDSEESPLPEGEGPAAQWFLEVNSRLVRDLESIVLGQWEAFAQFCREDLRLEPETVLEVCMAPALETVQKALLEMEGIQADPARVEERRDLLGRLWHRQAGILLDSQ